MLSRALLERIEAGGATAGLLIFPGQIEQRGTDLVLVRETLVDDLDRQPPRLPPNEITITGYAASWLGGRYALEKLHLYEAPSGRRLPIFRLVGERFRPHPWHNPEVLGRRVIVERPAVRRAFL